MNSYNSDPKIIISQFKNFDSTKLETLDDEIKNVSTLNDIEIQLGKIYQVSY
jgi:beta-glucosidase/6-phospho-beta-glucosidase/beta-galactosidase